MTCLLLESQRIHTQQCITRLRTSNDSCDILKHLVLPSERASFHQSGFSSGGLAENGRARAADDNSLRMREDCGYVETARTFDIHEERSRGLDKLLQLVLLCLSCRSWVEQID